MKRTALLACAVSASLAAGSIISIGTVTGCGSSDPDSGFENGGTSGGASGGASGSGGILGGGTSGTSGASGAPPPAEECKKMDIVFVIDNSGSMKEEQTNLAANFPKFVNVINAYKTKSGAELEYRVAITSSDDTKDKGKFFSTRGEAATAGCSPGPARPWLERGDGDVSAAFSCRAQIGIKGSGTERPLESLTLGVSARIADKVNTNNGASFLREDALLAFVIITDEDEGSAGDPGKLARPMASYPGEFDKVKGERGRWAGAVIAGPTKCTSPGLGDAAEAKRLKSFITGVGKNGVFASICTGDLTDGLTQALATFDQACKDFPSGPVK
jgi:hypothetical protein